MTPESFGPESFYLNSSLPKTINPAELIELAKIYVEAFSGAPWLESWEESLAVLEISNYLSDGILKIERSNEGKALGFGIALPFESYSGAQEIMGRGFLAPAKAPSILYIAELCTKSEARGKGICTKIVSELIKEAEGNGYSALITRTRTDNLTMIKIFERAGFVAVGAYATETGGLQSERVVMIKEI